MTRKYFMFNQQKIDSFLIHIQMLHIRYSYLILISYTQIGYLFILKINRRRAV